MDLVAHGVVDMKKELIILMCILISLALGLYLGSFSDIQKYETYSISFQGNGNGGGTNGEEGGDGGCVPACVAYDCTRTTTFKFKVDMILTLSQLDKYSVVPFDGEQNGAFPVKINATFADYDELNKNGLVDNVNDGDKQYLPIWVVDGKYYVYGDSQPKEKFIFLGVKPDVDIKEKYEYVLWENGITIDEVKGKDCNVFDGSQCRKIPYSLNYETFNNENEKIPYDWLRFVFKFKHYSEWTK